MKRLTAIILLFAMVITFSPLVAVAEGIGGSRAIGENPLPNSPGIEIGTTGTGGANITTPFGYRGEYKDSETGNIYLRARYYSPNIGRFTTSDPAKADGYNWYSYCGNDPVNFVDPWGLKLQLSNSATSYQKEEYRRAIEYLKKSEAGKALIKKLEDEKDVIFTISFLADYTKSSSYIPDTRTINWTYLGGLVMGNGTSVTSAALGLAHEMGHGAQHLDGGMDGFFKRPTPNNYLKIEEANLEKYERTIARQLGEPTRTSYTNTNGKIKMNNSIHYITTNSSRYGRRRTFTVNHNEFPIIIEGATFSAAR